MTDSKPLSPMERIRNMNAWQAAAHLENMRAAIWNSYSNVFQWFLSSISYVRTPYNLMPLQYPFLYFYLKDPKKPDSPICTIADFQYGNHYKSHIITRKTFPYFLCNQCTLPPLPDNIIAPMFDALDQLIRMYPRSALETLLEHLRSMDPQLAAFLSLPKTVCLSREGNLYINHAAISQGYTPYLSAPFQSVLDMQWPNVPDKLLYRVFKELASVLSASADGHIDHEAVRYDHTAVLGVGASDAGFISARYQPDSDSFEGTKCYWADFQLKRLPLRAFFSTKTVSDTLYSFFQVLCGDSTAAVDALSRFLSQAMDPALPGMTVIYTKRHPEQLLTVLSRLFQDGEVSADLKPRKNGASALPSLNQLTKGKTLRELFIAQSNSKGVVFARDLPASEGNLRALRKLLKGTKIALRSSYLPPQSYYNTLHIICVSDDFNRVKTLQKQFKSLQLIDLSVCEEAGELPALSDDDYNWIRSAFLLYGLKLRTLEKEQLPDPASCAQAEPLPDLTSEIAVFLDGCERREGLCCDTFRLYEGFVRFYKSRHCGADPATTKIKFNKEARSIIAMHYGKTVVYHKIRTPQMVGWYYVGLDLPSDPPPLPPERPPELLQYLLHINTYGLGSEFEPVRSRCVVRPLPEAKG